MEDLFPKLFAILVAALLFLALALTIRAIARDARRRGKPPVLVVLLCLLSFPLGLIVWLIFRPALLPSNQQQFRLRDHRVQ
jgi:Na+/H+-dicarboxylate symporter